MNDNEQRDELAREHEHLWLSDLRKHPNGEVRLFSADGKLISGTYAYQVTRSVDAMVQAATLTIITTVEGLNALPVGSVVLSKDYIHHASGMRITFQKWDSGFWHRGGRSEHTHPDFFLPATVIHEPTPEATK